MRVLLIHQYFLEDDDGGGTRWNDISRVWLAAGTEVTALAGTEHYMGISPGEERLRYSESVLNRPKINADGVKVIRCYVPSNHNSGFVARLLAYFAFTFSSILGGIFYAREKYDVIIVTSPPLFVGITALVLSWLKGIPFVFEVRDLWTESAIEMGLLKNKLLIRLSHWFEKYLYRKAALVTVLTPAFREILVAQKQVEQEKLILIPNGADFELAGEVGSTFDVSDFRECHHLTDKFVITYVGAHGIANHLIQILETAELLQQTNVCFLLIGDGMEKEELKREKELRGLKNIMFIGRLPKREVFKYILASDMGASVLKKADIFKTVYSNKTFDYFSCGKPVLMAIDGISRSLVEDANAGMFVQPENPADFAAKIRSYINEPDLLKKQGENGYIYAKKYFDKKTFAAQYLNEIKNLF